MEKKYDVKLFHEVLSLSLDEIDKNSDFSANFYDALLKGERKLYQKQFTKIKKFDDEWIETIESYFPSIDRITRQAKSHLRYDEEIVPIEKAKKVGTMSIKHLSSSTRYLRQVGDDEDELMPTSILTDLSDIEYGIYENRFIMTLIYKLQAYIHERIKILRNDIYGKKQVHFNNSSELRYNKAKFSINIDIKKEETIEADEVNLHNLSVLIRTEKLYKLINALINSQFIRIMNKYKKVSPPIIKTQVILKNPDFKNAYFLWMYLDQSYQLDFELESKEANKEISEDYEKSLNKMLLHIFSTMVAYEPLSEKESDYVINPVIKHKPLQVVKQMPVEFVVNDLDSKTVVETQAMNEYYLAKMKDVLRHNIELKEDSFESVKVSLKKALEDMILITNTLFESFFQYNADEDYFRKLIFDKDPVRQLDKANQRHKIASIVRKIKEDDYYNALKLEEKWSSEIEKWQEELLASETKSSKARILKAVTEKKKKLEEETKAILAEEKQRQESELKKQANKLSVYKEALDKKRKEVEKQIKEAEKEAILEQTKAIEAAALEKVKTELSLEKATFKEKEKAIKVEQKAILEEIKKEKDSVKPKTLSAKKPAVKAQSKPAAKTTKTTASKKSTSSVKSK